MSKQQIQLDGHKLMYHVKEVSRWLDDEMVAPIYVEIDPINACNHNCIFCALDFVGRKGHKLNKEKLIESLKDMADYGVKSIMFSGEGEPLLYKDLSEAMEKAKSFGFDIALTTNGVLLDEKKLPILKVLSWIKVSIDAGKQETYAKIHGAKEEDFGVLLKNLKVACKYIKKNKLDVTIGAQMILLNENINEIETLIPILKGIGINYLTLKPYSQHPDSINRQTFDIKKYDSYITKVSEKQSSDDFKIIYRSLAFKEIESKAVGYNYCYGLSFYGLIDAHGNVIPCNLFHEKSEYVFGNIHEKSFSEIWEGSKRREILKRLYDKGCKDCRVGCRLNFMNQYLHTLKNRDKKHINFI